MYRELAEKIGEIDLLMITFDSLRFDVAERAWREGKTSFLRQLLPAGWEARHTPGSFTYAAHAAFFAGFFPTPAAPGIHARPFSLQFPPRRGEKLGAVRLEGSTLMEGLRAQGYHTLCIGGVGFFSELNPLGSVFPRLFDESHWEPAFGVSEPASARRQIECACKRLDHMSGDKPVFLFLNLSAMPSPTYHYLQEATEDSIDSQQAALEYVDRQLPPLFEALQARGRGGWAFLMSDHGTTFGEDGYFGHRLARPAVWQVPYGECRWEGRG